MDSSMYAGGHRIVRRLGLGRSSEVLLAVASGPFGFERTVVIKRLLQKFERESELQRLLVAEALAHARLTHPAIVRLYDFVWNDDHLELILEYVDGVSLARLRTMQRVQGESLGDPSAYFIASRIFSALASAHAVRDPSTGDVAPVIHRDVSPGNVLIPWDGFVKLSDFGLAKVTGVSADTRAGLIKGTYGYMAPEQVLGERVTPRTDVYAGCIVLREMLLSRPTFVRGEMPELEFLRAMAEPQLAPIESLRSGLSPALVDAMRRGLNPDPEKRTLTADEMVEILRTQTDLDRAHVSLVDKLARVRPTETRGSMSQRSMTPWTGMRVVTPRPTEGAARPISPPTPTNLFGLPAGVPQAREITSRPRAMFDTPAAMAMPSNTETGAVLDDLRVTAIAKRPRIWLLAAAGLCAAALTVMRMSGAGSHADEAASAHAAEQPRAAEEAAGAAAIASRDPAAKVVRASVDRVAAGAPSVTSAPSVTNAPSASRGAITTPAWAHDHRIFVDGAVAAAHGGSTIDVACGPYTIRVGSHGVERSIDVPCGGVIEIR